MPSAKQRGSKGGHGAASPSEKGAHPSGGADDVAKKPPPAPQQPPPPAPHPQQHPPPPPQSQTHGKGHRGGKLGRALNWLFYLVLVAAAAFSGWCVHHVLEEVQEVRSSHQDFCRQREELGQGLQGVEQKVQSLQATLGTFESFLRTFQHKQELAEKVMKQGESEINRISEVLQKLQNEILKDLSDGIHVVKDARERDFTSLENTVEERLTELTKSINDNIAIFTEVQKRSQKEINDVKAKVASLEHSEGDKQELKALKEVVKDIQTSLKSKEKDLEALRSTLQTMESDVTPRAGEPQTGAAEVQGGGRFGAPDVAGPHGEGPPSEEATSRLPEEVRRLAEELRQLKAQSLEPEEDGVFKHSDALDALQRKSQGLDARLQTVEDGVQDRADGLGAAEREPGVPAGQERGVRAAPGRPAAAPGRPGLLGGGGKGGLASTVRSLGEAQLSLYSDVEELKRSVGELPSTVDTLQKVQEQVHTLLGQDQAPRPACRQRTSWTDCLLWTTSSPPGVGLEDAQDCRGQLGGLLSENRNNENNLESAKGLLDDLRNDLDRLFVQVEKNS
ncbi:LOW QUALITY PROTEIN: hypothetical protein QTO34_017945 [Cnephaeus nilssonii]|uniref:Cytoskeleton-associated protein 4 n=1 Tax=Cnephaeus nilssonii TaxID=3371016 RepID=A0AA40I209_CNENI|nr:LOW QUALITY PROTEIN: hypothetical protein QTO34_017945 [Eptesicus nilssonii]